MEKISIAIAQLNFTVGDIEGNKKKILQYREEAAAQGADLVIFPELALTGYPPEDLVLRPSFQDKAEKSIKEIASKTKKDPAVIFGSIHATKGKIYNSAIFIAGGKVRIQPKHELPNYGVFDEKRVFAQGPLPKPISFNGMKLGIMVCEDMWFNNIPKALKSADLLISINSSPFEISKHGKRYSAAKQAIAIAEKPIIYVNMAGGQDELVFDGGSFIVSGQKKIIAKLPSFEEKLQITTWSKKNGKWVCDAGKIEKEPGREEAIYSAMMIGLKDYVGKNGFPGVVMGLSGGVDSALSAAVAVDALGAKHVHGLIMPSRYTAQESIRDAEELADNLRIKTSNVSIEQPYTAFLESLEESFSGKKPDTTEENIQARVRGILLMAFSNKFGFMVLTTGNKSEMSAGYATLYGDMCGGYSVLKDVYKTEVYRLSNWRNNHKPKNALGPDGEVIPENTITRAPTAELRENQKDQDSLPPYDVLDDILEKLIESEATVEKIVKSGHKRETVEKVLKMLINSEYKRRQAPPGVKITAKSFGRDRRYPITNKFKQ